MDSWSATQLINAANNHVTTMKELAAAIRQSTQLSAATYVLSHPTEFTDDLQGAAKARLRQIL
jgi:hypothetical protein